MTEWLEHLQQQADEEHGAQSAYVHPRVLRFASEKQKTEWVGYIEEAENLDVFGRLEKAKKGGRAVWVALVVGPCESYVGKTTAGSGRSQWQDVVEHMWAVAIVNRAGKGKGKELFIFDCDATVPEAGDKVHAKDLDTQLQRVFVGEVKK